MDDASSPALARHRSAARARARLVVALVALAATALVACGGDDVHLGPTPTPTPVASPTPFPTPTGTGSGAFPIAADLAGTSAVTAAFGDGRYLVTFADTVQRSASDVFGVRLTADGDVVDAAPFLLSEIGGEPFLGPDGAYVPGGIAFADAGFGAFLFGSGTLEAGIPGQVVAFVAVPPAGPPALPATPIDEQASFSMVQTAISPPIAATSNGTLFLGVYQHVLTMVGSFSIDQVLGQIVSVGASGVSAQLVGPWSGIVPPEGGVVTSGSVPGVATRSDSSTLVAWIETVAEQDMPSNVSTRLRGVVLTESAATFVTLAEAQAGAQPVAVASDGTSFLVVWETPTAADPATSSELRAIRYTPGGEPTPAGGFVVAGGAAAKQLGAVAFAGGVYLVAWTESGVLRGARLGTAGDTVEPFTIDPGPAVSVDLASDGTRFLAVFDRPDGSASSDVLGTFVALE